MTDGLTIVHTYGSHIEADIAVSALEAAGIEAIVRADDCGGAYPTLTMGGAHLLVKDEDAAAAREVLDETSETGL